MLNIQFHTSDRYYHALIEKVNNFQDINYKDENGYTLLHYAAKYGQIWANMGSKEPN